MYLQPTSNKILWKKKTQKKRKHEEIQEFDEINAKKDYNETIDSNSDNHSDPSDSNSQKKKRGPKTGFINNKVNNVLEKILKQSNIPFEMQENEIVINYEKRKSKSSTEDKIVKEFSILYQKHFNPYKINSKNTLSNSFEIISKKDFEINDNSTLLKDIHPKDLNIIKYNDFDTFSNVDYNLISDFFKYSFTISLIINPSVMLLRIQQKSLTSALLFAIYSGAYLHRPIPDKEKAKYYSYLSKRCLFNNLQSENIQNIQTAFILSNLEPGTKDSYLLSGLCCKLLYSLNTHNNCSNDKDFIFNRENTDTFWTCINNELLLNLTCNCLPNQLNWLDQVIPNHLTDPFLLEDNKPSNIGIKYFAISGLLVKVLKHVNNRNNGTYNNEEFIKLKEDSENVHKLLKYDYDFINNSKYKNEMKFQLYTYILFFATKLILFNINLSPFVYGKRLNTSKKYILIEKKQNNLDSNIEKTDSKDTRNTLINDDDINPLNDNGTSNKNNSCLQYSIDDFLSESFKEKYQTLSILEQIPYPGFNYRLYNKSEKIHNNKNPKFLKLYPMKKDIDYEKHYNICFDIAEKAEHFLKKLNRKQDQKTRIYYPWYLGFAFYNIGLFYMLVYANLKNEKVKEDIEFFHKQIKEISNYFPSLSYYYSKMYQNAKMDAYEAFSDDSILFCPNGLYY